MHDLGAFKLTGWQAGSQGSSQHTLRVGLEHCNRLQLGRDRDWDDQSEKNFPAGLCQWQMQRDGLRPTPGLGSPAAVAERSVLSSRSCMVSVTLRLGEASGHGQKSVYRQKGDAHTSVDIAIVILFGIPNGRGPEFFAACAIKTWDGHPMARWQS